MRGVGGRTHISCAGIEGVAGAAGDDRVGYLAAGRWRVVPLARTGTPWRGWGVTQEIFNNFLIFLL
jgi:hypothetical protein